MLHSPRRPGARLLGERRNVSGQPEAAGALADLDEIVPIAVDLIQAIVQRSRGRTLKQRPAGARQRKAGLVVRQRKLRHHSRNLRRLRTVRLQELASRREVIKEVVDLDDRALGGAHLCD